MPAKKQKPRPNQASQDSEITITLPGYDDPGSLMTSSYISGGAGVDIISGGAGVGTITIDSSWNTGSITSASTVAWNQDYIINNSYTTTPSVQIDTNGIDVKEGGDIKIGGKSLSEAIDKIEERLGILRPNPELEDRWEQLKLLRKQYMELEKDLLEKEKIMDILKKE